MKPCTIHNFQQVNNRYYFTGKPVPANKDWADGKSEWKTENKCEKCGYVLEIPEFYRELIKPSGVNKHYEEIDNNNDNRFSNVYSALWLDVWF